MKPILCNYYITYRCNSRCVYCDIWKKKRNRHQTDCDVEHVFKHLPELAKLGVRFIDFTGGEPLLHQHLPLMLKQAKKYHFITSVTTNCILYPKYAHELANRVDLLHFSIDSLDPNLHDKIRGRDSHRRVMESIALAQKIGERPDLLFTVTEENYRSIDKLSQFAREQKLILIVNPVFDYKNQKSIKTEILNYLDQFKAEPYVYINRALHHLIRQGGNKRNQPRCRAVSSSVVISPENEIIFPCFHYPNSVIPIKGSLEKIYHFQRIKMENRQGTFTFCEHCSINCYFDPSFLYKIDSYFWLSVLSKLKYGIDKYIRPQ